ncbi:hypothetical protein [Metamycoplasma alkalescens]|uniref:hypothetical protein n=1 Tax=Metamycoplasma alkalescens TaxID=45363 RepID=UPI00147572AF|nr:hypothetical protein [Metamycoplasma alkalescens]
MIEISSSVVCLISPFNFFFSSITSVGLILKVTVTSPLWSLEVTLAINLSPSFWEFSTFRFLKFFVASFLALIALMISSDDGMPSFSLVEISPKSRFLINSLRFFFIAGCCH